MTLDRTLADKTLFITGGSRGIGLAIALAAARQGANVAVAAKTATAQPTLPSTIYDAAEAIEAAGGKALPLLCDVRDETMVAQAVQQTVDRFGGIDICVNNASAINLSGTQDISMKRFDLMQQVNTRATFMVSKLCLPHLRKSGNPHILVLSPPLDLQGKWFRDHPAYTLSKFGMSLCVLGLSAEFAAAGIAVNALWPMTAIDTAAVRNLLGGAALAAVSRTPQIMADSALAILTRDARGCSGNFFIDEEVLRDEGVTDFAPYAVSPGSALARDLFVPDASAAASVATLITSLSGK